MDFTIDLIATSWTVPGSGLLILYEHFGLVQAMNLTIDLISTFCTGPGSGLTITILDWSRQWTSIDLLTNILDWSRQLTCCSLEQAVVETMSPRTGVPQTGAGAIRYQF